MKELESTMKKLGIILLLLATGCAHELTAPLSTVPVTSMADYFWTGSAINFKDDSTNAITDQITFRDSSTFLLANDADATGKMRTTVACTVSQDTVFAENFVLGSVLDMDNGSYFSPLDTVTLIPHVLDAAVIGAHDSAYVATDSGVWSAIPSGSFGYDGIDSISDIDALASSPTGSIYAATRSGHIWVRDPGSKKWSTFPTSGLQPNSAITALACDANGLYAVVENQPGVNQCLKGSSSWLQFSPLMSTNTISALHADVYFNYTEYLVIGSTDGTVGGSPATGTKFQQTIGSTGTDTIYDIAAITSKFLCAATANGIYVSDPSANFPAAPTIAISGTRSLTFDNTSNALFFISDGLLYSATTNGGSAWSFALLPKNYSGTPLKLFSQSSASYLLTDSSLYQHTGSGWNPVPGFPRTYYPKLQGGLLLLKSNPVVDSSWRAGTLVTINHQSYPITARLLSRLDSLVIGGKSYSDVLVVRYARESTPRVVDPSLPYWVIYYQRGRGPIMFDRVNVGGALERRAVSN